MQLPLEDPKIKTELYLKAHNVDGIFENILQQLMVSKPENPRQAIVDALVAVKESGPQMVINDGDLKAMFSMFDITNKKKVAITQADSALKTILGSRAIPAEDASRLLDQAEFVEYMSAAIKHGISNPRP